MNTLKIKRKYLNIKLQKLKIVCTMHKTQNSQLTHYIKFNYSIRVNSHLDGSNCRRLFPNVHNKATRKSKHIF